MAFSDDGEGTLSFQSSNDGTQIYPGDRVITYSLTGEILLDKKFHNEIGIKALIAAESNQLSGLVIFNLIRANGDQRQMKFFIRD